MLGEFVWQVLYVKRFQSFHASSIKISSTFICMACNIILKYELCWDMAVLNPVKNQLRSFQFSWHKHKNWSHFILVGVFIYKVRFYLTFPSLFYHVWSIFFELTPTFTCYIYLQIVPFIFFLFLQVGFSLFSCLTQDFSFPGLFSLDGLIFCLVQLLWNSSHILVCCWFFV